MTIITSWNHKFKRHSKLNFIFTVNASTSLSLCSMLSVNHAQFVHTEKIICLAIHEYLKLIYYSAKTICFNKNYKNSIKKLKHFDSYSKNINRYKKNSIHFQKILSSSLKNIKNSNNFKRHWSMRFAPNSAIHNVNCISIPV